jgi:hypothetical protein
MATVRELTLPMALELAEHLDNRDRIEILRAYPDLERWALDRCTLPGMAWALLEDGAVVLAGGVVTNGLNGTLWLAGRPGWRKSIKHPLRIWRAIRESRFCERFECQCAEDNPIAQHFAQCIGFTPEGTRAGVVHYGMGA